ncbi:MAG TPA: hypothetical protein VN767_15505 [Streptosporangiaceae bacterium]|jgi:hypothetical protein|nr:hypothetical protein [Streptosporangiaceae bacterium]
MRTFSQVIAISGFGAMAVASTLVAPGMAAAAPTSKPLPCHASMSNARPADNTKTVVNVKSVANARITTVAHYRTVNREHHGRTNRQGKAGIPYYISRATPGFKVIVDVTVKWPHRTGTCRTSFVPHA